MLEGRIKLPSADSSLAHKVGTFAARAETITGNDTPIQIALNVLSGFQATQKTPAEKTKSNDRGKYSQWNSGIDSMGPLKSL